MIALITPTGARAAQMELCAKWMRNQTYNGTVVWIIVDDAKPNTAINYVNSYFRDNWIIMHVIPPNPSWIPGMNTQPRNLRVGIEEVEGLTETYDCISSVFIIEDDDYYAPTYLEEMVKLLDTSKIVGEQQSMYYHVKNKRCYRTKGLYHSSLFQTAFDISLLETFKSCLKGTGIDIAFWNSVKEGRFLFYTDKKPLSVGIKGMKGRNGIGIGHLLATRDLKAFDENASTLKELIGKGADEYEKY